MSPGVESVPGRDGQTERRTDRIAIANMRSAVPAGAAVARKHYRCLYMIIYASVRLVCT